MHAEVLAKRGFVVYLKNVMQNDQNNEFESCANNLTLHFYVSSAPCGNSVIKKWAKPTLGPAYEYLPDSNWPKPSDEKFYYTAKSEGQGCLLTKGQSKHCETKLMFEMPSATQLWSVTNACHKNNEDIGVQNETCVSPLQEDVTHPSFTCSDKILFWQHLGWQGKYLLNTGLFKKPLRLSTITVGRKYSEPHLRRALYGRYTPTKNMLKKGAPLQNALTCLVTSLKLDESVYEGENTAEDACFKDQRCYWWCTLKSSMNHRKTVTEVPDHEQNCYEILDGKTGKIFDTNGQSKLSKGSLSQNSIPNESKCDNLLPSEYSINDYTSRKLLMIEFFKSVQPDVLQSITC